MSIETGMSLTKLIIRIFVLRNDTVKNGSIFYCSAAIANTLHTLKRLCFQTVNLSTEGKQPITTVINRRQ